MLKVVTKKTREKLTVDIDEVKFPFREDLNIFAVRLIRQVGKKFEDFDSDDELPVEEMEELEELLEKAVRAIIVLPDEIMDSLDTMQRLSIFSYYLQNRSSFAENPTLASNGELSQGQLGFMEAHHNFG